MNPDQPPSNGAPPTIGAAFRLAGRFLLPLDPAVDAQHPSWTRAAVWLPVWGLLIGVVYAAIFRVTWLWLGEYQRMRLAPMVILLAFDVGFFGYRLLDGAARLLAMRPGRASIEPQPASLPTALVPVVVLVVLAVLGKFALLAALPAGAVPYPADWREHLHTLYPYVIFRPLILMPLWGRWGILLASSIGRVSPAASTRMGRLAEGNSLTIVLLYWAAATAVTVLYCSPAGQHVAWSMLISLGMLLVAYLASFMLSRRLGGQTETTVLACGWAVELSFLLVYLPVARAIYWY